MVEEPSIVKHPSGFLWGAAVRAAARRRFKISMRCENAFKERIKSGLEVNKVGLYEFSERKTDDKRSDGGPARRMDDFSRALWREIVSWSLADLLKNSGLSPGRFT